MAASNDSNPIPVPKNSFAANPTVHEVASIPESSANQLSRTVVLSPTSPIKPIDADTLPPNRYIKKSLPDLILEAQDKKCQIKQAFLIDASKRAKVPQVFVIPHSTKVYCVCEAGMNRSQILHVIVKNKAPNPQFVEPPHGSTGGLDPFINEEDRIDSEGFPVQTPYAYAKLPEAKNDLFNQLMKTDRVPRLIEDFLTPDLNPSPYNKRMVPRFEKALLARSNLRIMFDSIFDEAIKRGAVFMLFNKALHVTLFRLLERANILKRDLNKIIIYPIQSDDPIVNNDYEQAQNFVDIFQQSIVFQ